MGSIVSYFYGYPDDHVIDPDVGLTGREKRIVKATWKTLRANSVNTGVAIMTSYFKTYPNYQKMFPAFKNVPLDELAGSIKFQAHCQSIMATLSNAFDALDSDVKLMDAILCMAGERHGRRGQGRQEFIDLKGVILEVMATALGSGFSTEVKATWDKTIDIVFSKIYRGMESETSLEI